MRHALRCGFTLIELLLVVAIIGVLAALAVPKYANTKQRGQRSAGIADLHALLMAQERFYSETGRYGGPADTTALKPRLSPGNGPLSIVPSGVPVGSTGFSATIVLPDGSTCGAFAGAATRPVGMAADTPASTPVCW